MAFDKNRNSTGSKTYDILTPMHEMDAVNGEDIRQYVVSVIESVDAVIINFSKITYMNSSGLRELIQILKVINNSNKMLLLADMNSDIRKIFKHTNLERLFIFCDDVLSAVKTIK